MASLALFLMLGAGCADTSETPSTKPAVKQLPPQETIELTVPPTDDDIVLKATPMGPNTVNFEWTLSKQIDDMAEGWRIVYGLEENPTYPSNWWFERGVTYRDKLWKGLPAGDAHFRLCALINDECDTYSNDVFVTVEGEEELSAEELCEQTEGAVWEEESESCFEDPDMMVLDEEMKKMNN